MLPGYPLPTKLSINGREELSFADTLRDDEEYARRRSLGLALRILLATGGAVAQGRGA